jgi:hypothetical protein
MPRHHRFWIGSLALSALALALAAPARAADIGKYLPNDTDGIVTVNVRQLLDAPLLKDGIAQLKKKLQEDEPAKILAALGFDPLKDVDTVTLAGPLSKEFLEKSLVVINGKFDVAKFQKAAEQHAKDNAEHLKITKVGNYKVWEVSGVNHPPFPDTIYATMVDKTTVLVSGSKDCLKEALAKADGKKTTELRKEIGRLLKKADLKQTALVLVDTAPLANLDIPNVPQDKVKEVLEKVKNLTLAVKLTKDVTIQLGIGTTSADEAKKMAEELNKLLLLAPGLIALAGSDNPQIAPFVDVAKKLIKATKITSKESTMVIKAVLTQDLLKEIGEAVKKAQSGD